MKDLIIFGANDLGRLIKYYLEEDGDKRRIVAFTMNAEYIKEKMFQGLPVVPFEEITKHYAPEKHEILIAIGYSKMNEIRKKVYQQCKEAGYSIASFIHSSCTIHTDEIGEGNIFLEDCMVYPFASVGDGNLMWERVIISHDCEVGDFNTFSSCANLCGYVTIGNNCFFGKNSVIKEHSDISDYTLVGATAFSDRNTKPYDVVVPARSVILEHKKSTDLM